MSRLSRCCLLAVAGATLTVAPAASAALPLNTKPGQLLVYNNNLDNLKDPAQTCNNGGNWKKLIDAMGSGGTQPDIFVVQQVNGRKDMRDIIREIKGKVGGKYKYRVADPTPNEITGESCADKKLQTNGIIWNDGRLKFDSAAPPWQAKLDDGGCKVSRQSRTEGLTITLRDRKPNRKRIRVTSMHWPKKPGCRTESARETVRVATAGTSAVQIVAGDTNTPGTDPWRDVFLKRNFKDPFPETDWTIAASMGMARVDYLFARGPGVSVQAPATIGFDDPAVPYSEHRALRGLVKFRR